MTRQVLAFFAASFLSVAISIPAFAREVDGTVEAIDREHAKLRLSDGSIYDLPDHFNYEAVEPGMTVVLIVEEHHGVAGNVSDAVRLVEV